MKFAYMCSIYTIKDCITITILCVYTFSLDHAFSVGMLYSLIPCFTNTVMLFTDAKITSSTAIIKHGRNDVRGKDKIVQTMKTLANLKYQRVCIDRF